MATILVTAVDPQVATDVVAIMEPHKVVTAMLEAGVATVAQLLVVMVATAMPMLATVVVTTRLEVATTMAIQETVVAIEATAAVVIVVKEVLFSSHSHPQRIMVSLAKKIRYRKIKIFLCNKLYFLVA